MITVGIQPEKEGYHERWARRLEERGARVKWLNLLGPDPIAQARDCRAVMWHWPHYPHDRRWSAKSILHVLESELGILTFPDIRTAWHYDDKIAQHYLFSALDLPAARTWLFWSKPEALAWAETAPYPVVFKLSCGAGSSNVQVVPDQARAGELIEQMFSPSGRHAAYAVPPASSLAHRARRAARALLKRGLHAADLLFRGTYPPLPEPYWMPQKNYALFQEFLPGNDFDTRITVVGNRAFGYRRMNRRGDFRASGSGVFDPDPSKIDLACMHMAFASAAKLKMQSCAFDFLNRDGRPVIIEISYCYVNWMVERCPGHWDSALRWHPGHCWPEEAHVDDLLDSLAAAPSR